MSAGLKNTILAMESADGRCSVALLRDGAGTLRINTEMRDSLSWMMQQVAELKREHFGSWSGLDGIACCVGPGGFTGVRVAVGYAQGLGIASGLPVAPVSSLDALAWQLGDTDHDGRLWVALDARMGELYAACYQRGAGGLWQRQGDERLGSAAALADEIRENDILAGPGFESCEGLDGVRRIQGIRLDAGAVAACARCADDWRPAGRVLPRYLRHNVAQTLVERGLQAPVARSAADPTMENS